MAGGLDKMIFKVHSNQTIVWCYEVASHWKVLWKFPLESTRALRDVLHLESRFLDQCADKYKPQGKTVLGYSRNCVFDRSAKGGMDK